MSRLTLIEEKSLIQVSGRTKMDFDIDLDIKGGWRDVEVSDENRVKKQQAQARRNQRRLWWVSALSWSTLALAITGFITAWNQVSHSTPQSAVSAFSPTGSGSVGSVTGNGGTSINGYGEGSGDDGFGGGGSNYGGGYGSGAGSGLFGGASGSGGTSGFGSAGPSQSGSGLFGSGAS